jgi:hypothetical protein
MKSKIDYTKETHIKTQYKQIFENQIPRENLEKMKFLITYKGATKITLVAFSPEIFGDQKAVDK